MPGPRKGYIGYVVDVRDLHTKMITIVACVLESSLFILDVRVAALYVRMGQKWNLCI